ncbi:Stk1 family PASTA domain-containing Ser/Thr kinase [Leucobacter weissii]|uniref:non-specific serine/threonine protein kinase n=1 Tax=Leucobacter weissii TaxID=1983706 RepID=A0A939MHZ8_9MICO|nr:Stk1 family PASTA domain-containing Ser/Thr kinase [Leucobacter weissii]MBO1901293.1 Stk1 family PASTA domain-containing Ser/Thr kinase [Leucobacter weissii]
MTETVGSARLLADRYSIGEYIGQGGMSTVYRGVDTKLGRQVAVKVMRAHLAGDDQFRSRFRQEAQSASRLAHPSIVRVFDAGDDLIQTGEGPQQLPFIVMEYVDGQNLREIIEQDRLSTAEACRVVEAVLTALEYSHRAGIVHRDIKPANIMITTSGQVKVMDFGIARAVSETSSTVQQTTAILGTAAYFSPEQAKGEAIDARTDLYSTGVLLYELLTGDVPFRGDTAVAVAYQHVSERPEPPSQRDPAVSAPLERVVLHALAKDRARRFQSAREYREALRLAASGTMPKLSGDGEQAGVLFSSGEEVSESDLALRRLSESGGGARSHSRPPVMWVWAAILTVVAVVAAVLFWLLMLSPSSLAPTSSREIPPLTGVSAEEAMRTLEQLDLLGVSEEEANDEVAAGHVIRTDPEPGASVNIETTVRVYVSTGPDSAEVPDFDRMTLEDYTAELEDLGLGVGAVSREDDSAESKDTVLEVDPRVGTRLERGETVELTVSSGKVRVPDVKGQSVAAAKDILESLRLALTITPDPNCSAEGAAIITRQSVEGKQDQGSPVEIFYCSG